jgi:hypothetical protein
MQQNQQAQQQQAQKKVELGLEMVLQKLKEAERRELEGAPEAARPDRAAHRRADRAAGRAQPRQPDARQPEADSRR